MEVVEETLGFLKEEVEEIAADDDDEEEVGFGNAKYQAPSCKGN